MIIICKDKNICLKRIYFISAVIVFLCGIAIYTFFRNLNIVLFQYIPKPLFLDSLYIPVKQKNIFIMMFLYNLPDGLWFLSGLLLIRTIWLDNHRWRLIYFIIFSFIALTIEISQLFAAVPGTFDLFDIVFMAFFAFLESVIFKRLFKNVPEFLIKR